MRTPPIPFSDVQRKYGAQLLRLEVKRVKSKSKNASDPLSAFTFCFEWGEEIQVLSGGQLLRYLSSGAKPPDEYVDATSLDAKIDARCKRASGVTLVAENHRCRLYTPMQDEPLPDEVISQITNQEIESEKVRQEVANMTDEEREAEVKRALGGVRGGIFMLSARRDSHD